MVPPLGLVQSGSAIGQTLVPPLGLVQSGVCQWTFGGLPWASYSRGWPELPDDWLPCICVCVPGSAEDLASEQLKECSIIGISYPITCTEWKLGYIDSRTVRGLVTLTNDYR